MASEEMARQVRWAMLEASVLALLRSAQEDGFDGVSIMAEAHVGLSSIDVQFMQSGVPMQGHSL